MGRMSWWVERGEVPEKTAAERGGQAEGSKHCGWG